MATPTSTPTSAAQNLPLYLTYTSTFVFTYGLQGGTTTLLLILLLLLTRPSKRTTPLFLLNTLALLTCTLRIFLQASYFWSDTWSFTAQFAEAATGYVRGDEWRIYDPLAWRCQMAAAVAAGAQSTAVMCSLFLQIRAVCVPMCVGWQRRAMLGVTAVVVAANIALAWIHSVVQIGFLNAVVESKGEVWYDPTQYVGLWQLVSWVNQGSIAYFSMVFCAKLGVVVVRRRRMGMRGFGAMEVVWVMAGQTMLVPAVFIILQPYTTVPLFSALSLTLVTIFLPFSAVWAAESMPDDDDEEPHNTHSYPCSHNTHATGSPSSSFGFRRAGHSSVSGSSFRTKLFGARTPRRVGSETSTLESPREGKGWSWSWVGVIGKGKSLGRGKGSEGSVEVREREVV